MRNGICAVGAFAAFALSSSAALAQDFGEQGQIVLSADRLFGFVHSSQHAETDEALFNVETDVTYDNFAFIGQGDVVSPFSNPRLSFDYFVIDGLTIGGSLSYWSTSTDYEDGPEVDESLFTLAPRVGYAFMFSEAVGFWPRGGFTFYVGETEADPFFAADDASRSGFGFNLDFPFVIVPAEHAAFLVGPGIDLGLIGGGEFDPGNVEYNEQIIDFGLYAGLAVWF